jgi:hypothetical protein
LYRSGVKTVSFAKVNGVTVLQLSKELMEGISVVIQTKECCYALPKTEG